MTVWRQPLRRLSHAFGRSCRAALKIPILKIPWESGQLSTLSLKGQALAQGLCEAGETLINERDRVLFRFHLPRHDNAFP